MKYGIYYAYWEKEWKADYIPYVKKVKELGFDILEIGCAFLPSMSDEYLQRLREEAEKWGVRLTGGYGPAPEHNIASADPAVVKAAFANYEKTFQKMKVAGMKKIGGGLYSYWPVDYSKPIDKQGDLARSIANVRELGDMAAAAATSRSGLQRKLKQAMGITPQDLLREARIKHASQLLTNTQKTIAEVAYACGFTDPKYFSRCFKQSTGQSPTEYKNAQ